MYLGKYIDILVGSTITNEHYKICECQHISSTHVRYVLYGMVYIEPWSGQRIAKGSLSAR